MGRIDELKAELIQAVLDSEEYREYKRLEAEVSKNADLKRAIDEFRRRNFEIQYNDEIQEIDENISQLEAQYADMRNQGLAKKLLFGRTVSVPSGTGCLRIACGCGRF